MRQFLIAALLAALPAVPVLGATETERTGLSAIDLFKLAEERQRDGRPEEALTLYDALSRDPHPEIRAEARFRKGQLLASEGRYTDAAVSYRALLDEKPDAAAVRLELARVLALAGEERAARRELRQARASGLPPDVALIVDQFSAALRGQNRFGGTMEVALAPDSNINRATSAQTLDTVIAPLTLSDDARQTSGMGLKLGGQLFVRVPLSGSLWLVPRVSSRADLYAKSQFNDVSASALVGLERLSGKGRIILSGGQTRRWYGQKTYADTTTAQIDLLQTLGPRTQLDVTAGYASARYRLNPLQNGPILSLSAGLERAFDARTGVRVGGAVMRQSAADPAYSTWSYNASFAGWREMLGSTMFATVGAGRLRGDEALVLFPEPRREWLLQATVGATVRKLRVHGFAPVARVRFERNFSNIELYDYRRLVLEGGISRAF